MRKRSSDGKVIKTTDYILILFCVVNSAVKTRVDSPQFIVFRILDNWTCVKQQFNSISESILHSQLICSLFSPLTLDLFTSEHFL